MLSPGQKCGTCDNIMVVFDVHLKCTKCCDEGVGEDLCVQKKDCPICKAFTAEQKLQLATHSYKARKEKEHSNNTSTAIPILVDHADYKFLGRVEGDRSLKRPLLVRRRKLVRIHPKLLRQKSANLSLMT